MGGSPKAPKAAPFIPSTITGETADFRGTAFARLRKRMASMFGRQSTILTTGSGTASPKAPTKTLLGA